MVPSDTPSETDTLLPEPSSPSRFDEPDQPILVDEFKRSIKICKTLLSVILPAVLILEGASLAELSGINDRSELIQGELLACGAGLILTLVVIALFVHSLYRPIISPTHRSVCTTSFILLTISIGIHVLPNVLYTFITKEAPPQHSKSTLILSWTEDVAHVAALIIAGSMRRGPKVQYCPPRLATGFGINAERLEPQADQHNVVDWSNSSILSLIFLSYTFKLAKRSSQVAQLARTDIPCLEEDARKISFSRTEAKRGQNAHGEIGPVTPWSLFLTIWADRGKNVIILMCLEQVKTAFSYLQVAAQYELVRSFSFPRVDNGYVHLLCWCLFTGQAVDIFFGSYLAVREHMDLHMPVRLTTAALLYNKILRTADAQAMEAAHDVDSTDVERSGGRSQVMNLLTVDLHTIACLSTLGPNITNGLLSLVLGIGLLYTMLGASAFFGIACIPLVMPAGIMVSRLTYRCDKALSAHRDARVAAIKEFVVGIKVIKLNAFEDYFKRNIERLRDVEVIWQRWRMTLGTVFNILADQVPVISILLTYIFHTKVLGRPLDPATAYAATMVFNRVKDSFSMIPGAVQAVVQAKVSLGRVTTFLNQPDVECPMWNPSDVVVVCSKARIGWPAAGPSSFKLVVDVEFPPGKFSLICGALGSGKTLLLRALLGECIVEAGYIRSPRSLPKLAPLNNSKDVSWTIDTWLTDSIAYAPQQSFIRHGTIRDNILFGQPLWPERYRETLRQASLVSDLSLMDDGDLTEIGDKGITLSGGQKARINLARCIYSRARTIYMDDVLSAVDAHTSKYIIQQCFAGGLLKDRTVILVTHHVNLCLPIADFVVMLDKGAVAQACSSADINIAMIPLPIEKELEDPTLELYNDKDTSARQIYNDEYMAEGQVAQSHYLFVLGAAGGFWYWTILVLVYGIARAGDVAQIYWTRHWTSDPDPAHLDKNLMVYTALISGMVICGACRWIWLYGVGNVGFYNRGTRKIHKLLLDKVSAAPLSFFERTPAGRLMNIFGQDMSRLDNSTADDFGRTVAIFANICTAAVSVCVEAPLLITLFVVFGLPLYWVSLYVRKLRADLRRLMAVAGTPLISLFHDTIDGVVMVRAFGTSDSMRAIMGALHNREKQIFMIDWTVWNWIRSAIRAIATFVVTGAAFYIVHQDISAAQAGLLLTFVVRVTSNLYGALEKYSDLDQTFVSAERINHYVQLGATESADGSVPPPSWPERGKIAFKNLTVRYADDLPDVLHNVSVEIEAGQRVGIVGATGSGKSTLALTLFRAMDPREGSIEIDGRNIRQMQLKELRKRLNMVVQDGSLGSGTLRNALDITGLKDDREIYEALQRVHLLPEVLDDKTTADNPFANLDTFVAVEGANFSQGQKQLLCLARALLKKSKVLVMDEATSSIDFETDAKITATIRECFQKTTLIVIAHRLATIMNYDRVLVLEKGTVLEFGHPAELLKNTSSAFRALCMAQGPEEFAKLHEMIELQ